jgi:putative membrane protein
LYHRDQGPSVWVRTELGLYFVVLTLFFTPTGGDPDSVRGRLSLEIAQGALMILQSLAGMPAFLLYFCTAIVAVVAYLFVYTRVTPHDEFQLIRDNDPAAAIAPGLSLVGFVLPVVSAIAHSSNIVDCLIWSVIALIVQIAVFFIVKIPVPNLSAKIAAGELAAAIWLGLASLAAGALNAASMIY